MKNPKSSLRAGREKRQVVTWGGALWRETAAIVGQTATDFGLGKATARMLRYGEQAVVQLSNVDDGSVVHLVQKPEYAVALDRLLSRKPTERTITAQQDPGTDLREREGKAIGK